MHRQQINNKTYNRELYMVMRPIFKTVAALIVFIFILGSCKRGTTDEFTAKTGYFRQSVTETGELEAVRASVITMPQIGWQYGYQFKIIGLQENGKNVLKGDSVVSLDASSIFRFIIERESILENEVAAAKSRHGK
jgi:hypothetical protein